MHINTSQNEPMSQQRYVQTLELRNALCECPDVQRRQTVRPPNKQKTTVQPFVIRA